MPTYTANRWTPGNLIFPVIIEIYPDRVVRVMRNFFGRSEKAIPFAQVASVQVKIMSTWGAIRVNTTGGDYIAAKGFRSHEIEEMRRLIDEGRQRRE